MRYDYDSLCAKHEAISETERCLRDALEACAEIRYDGMDGIRAEMRSLIDDVSDCKDKIQVAMDTAVQQEQRNQDYGVPVWRDQ